MARRGYVQLVNEFYANEKVQELARSGRMDAVGVFCMALTYCGDHLTDGFVPRRAMLYVIGATGEQVNALCDVGMLEAVDEGWIIHDYTAHNRTKEQVLHARKKSAERVAKHRNESDVTALHRNCNAVTSGQTPEHQNTRTQKKDEEEYSSSSSKEIGLNGFELVREKAHANAAIIRDYPNLDLSDAWAAFAQHHSGETRSVNDWTRLWKGWCQRRANMSGIPPSKRHIHTWKCRHVLEALGRDEPSARHCHGDARPAARPRGNRRRIGHHGQAPRRQRLGEPQLRRPSMRHATAGGHLDGIQRNHKRRLGDG
jgi:hypothetical protein